LATSLPEPHCRGKAIPQPPMNATFRDRWEQAYRGAAHYVN